MNKIAFIINPIAGTHNKERLHRLICSHIDSNQYEPTLVTTEYAGHATELSAAFAQAGYYGVVAIGGDGTVNEVARALRGTNTALGIIPNGSGNGFARHLKIPLRVDKAIQLLNRSEVIQADYGMADDKPFISTCGMGFDALVAHQFAKAGHRGLGSYLHYIVEDLFQYKSNTYHLVGDGIDLTTEAFLITFANAGQWGYDAYIAPKASIQDGMMDIAILTKFPLHSAPELAIRLFTKHIDTELHITTIRARSIRVTRDTDGPMHIDGDALMMPATVSLQMKPNGLKILVEKRF